MARKEERGGKKKEEEAESDAVEKGVVESDYVNNHITAGMIIFVNQTLMQ